MLVFAFPWLLSVPLTVGIVGAWGILRAGRRTVAVSSTRLWTGLLAQGEVRRRRVDPLLAMWLLAAILAGLALAGPHWHREASQKPSARVWGSVRSTEKMTQLFLRLAEPQRLPPNVDVEISDGEKILSQSMAVAELMHGEVLTLPQAHAFTVTFRAKGTVVETLSFSRPLVPSFGLLTETSAGQSIDPALYRVFAVQANARVDDPTVSPTVVLVNSVKTDGVHGDGLVVASAETPLPGIVLGQKVPFAGEGAIPVGENLPAFVDLRHVRVRAVRAATFSPEWVTVVSVEGHPLVAVRRMSAAGPTVCWVGAKVSAETTWAADPSFVICFSEILKQALPIGDAGVEWACVENRAEVNRDDVPVDLGPVLGTLAISAIVGAMGMWMRRVVR